MVRGSLEKDTEDAIIVSKGVVESLQDDRPNTIASAICNSTLVPRRHAFGSGVNLTAICIVIKGLTVACLRQELSTTETGKDVGVRHDVEATSDRSVAITCP